MAKAIFNGTVVAESNDTIEHEVKTYFPPSSVKRQYLKDSDHTTYCTYKGDASYCHVEVNGQVAENGAWYYPEPKEGVTNIKGYFSFWNGVEVEK